jgi:hypothetical protein
MVHYVAVPVGNGTLFEAVDAAKGAVASWISLPGSWGVPTLGGGGTTGESVSRDGRTLVLGSTAPLYSGPGRFLVLRLNPMRVVRRIRLPGSLSFDALSPDASRLYLIQYTHPRIGDLSHYIVRGYDLRTNRLLPGRIADRTQRGWVMHGTPVSRAESAGGRWVYTLYENPGSYPFVHALDTKRGIAHCIQLPWEDDRSQKRSTTSSCRGATAAGRSRWTGGPGGPGCASPSAAGGSRTRAPGSPGRGPGPESEELWCS